MKMIVRTGKIILTVLMLLVIVVSLMLPAFTKAEPLDTYHSSWHLVRETADEDGATFAAVYDLTGLSSTVSGGNFAGKDTSTVLTGGAFKIPSSDPVSRHEGYSPGSKWMFGFCAKNYDVGADNTIDNTFSFNIVGWSKVNGMLQNIVEGDCIVGTQAVVIYPDSGDALGALIDMTGVAYTHADTTFTKTGVGVGVVAGMVIRVSASTNGSNLANGYYAVTGRTDGTIVCSGTGSSGNATVSVQSNPAFWADTINIDETTKWPRDGDGNNVMVYNSTDNEMAFIVIETTGLEYIQVVVYDALPAQTTEAGDITVYGRRF